MCRLHRLLNDAHQRVGQALQVHLVARRRTERGQRASRVVPATVKAAVDEALHTPSERLEQRRYHQSGGDKRYGRLLACGGPKGRLEQENASNVGPDDDGVNTP